MAMKNGRWYDDEKFFEQMRQNFTTTFMIEGPNMNLPQMSEKLVQMRDELFKLRASSVKSAERIATLEGKVFKLQQAISNDAAEACGRLMAYDKEAAKKCMANLRAALTESE